MNASTGEADVVLSRVRKSFGAVVAVDDVSLSIARGSIVSLLGPSGCGKTTTLRLVAGFERPDAGEVSIRGARVNDVPPYRRDFGMVSVADRKHAANNPKAYFYGKPITIEDHQNSRWIAEPLRLLDCCQETDGGVAIVVTTPERAKDLKHRPAIIEAASQGSSPDQYSMVSYYRPELGLPEMGLVGRQLWSQSGLTPADIQTAILYDHFTPFTLIQLEELGFCAKGDAKDFVADGAIEMGGRLPINTHGGQLGEAYIHGMNGIAEGVRQLRGTSVNQVSGVEHVLVTAGTGVPTSGLILG